MTFDVVDLEDRRVLTQIQATSRKKATEKATLLFGREDHFVGVRVHSDSVKTKPIFAHIGTGGK